MAATKKTSTSSEPSTKKAARKTPAQREVWDKKNPVKAHKHLTAAQKETAKTRAAKAGRRYPNMVDNMAVAKGAGTTSPASRKKAAPAKKKVTAAKTAAKKPAAKKPAAKKTTAAKKPVAKRIAGARPAAKKPGPKKSTTRKTAAKK